jgi:phospholipid/cholesterol/gamma-HCH transport system substrate-binding protein
MENRSYAIAVGLFTLLLGAALFLSFWWLNGSRQSVHDYVIVSQLPVTGLSTEASVKFRGVDVGKVTDIELDSKVKTNIIIRIEIIDTLQLTSQATAQIRSQGITGLSYINLDDTATEAQPLGDGANIPLKLSFMDELTQQSPELIAQFKTLLQSSSEMTATANKLMGQLDSDKLNKTLTNLERASEKLEPTLAALTNAGNRVSAVMSDGNAKQLSKTLVSLQETVDAAKPTLGELGETAKEFRNLASSVNQSTSDLSNTLNSETLPKINQLTESLNQDVSHANQLMDMLEDHPQSLLLGKPKSRPGPGETGFNGGKP